MRIVLHIGPDETGAPRLQGALAARREALERMGVLYSRAAGGANHTRLFMAVTDPDHVDPLRYNRGVISPDQQEGLRRVLAQELAAEVARAQPQVLILSASQIAGSLHRATEFRRLRDLLRPLSEDITVLAYVDEPARLAARAYAAQVMEGRATGLDVELGLVEAPDWWEACLDRAPGTDPQAGLFTETQAPLFWLDFQQLVRRYEGAFGDGSVRLRAFDPARFAGAELAEELALAFGIGPIPGGIEPEAPPAQPSAAHVARARAMNAVLLQVLRPRKRILPRALWRTFLSELSVDGPHIDPAGLGALGRRFHAANLALARDHGLDPAIFEPPPEAEPWTEADPRFGFRATQYLLGFMWRIDKAMRAAGKARPDDAQASDAPKARSRPRAEPALSETARAILPPLAVEKFRSLVASPFAPHDRLGAVGEDRPAPAYVPAPPRDLAPGSTGNVIVACMKNEAPYILEWIAHHRAIGIDTFLIYTNDCTDGTDAILARLAAMGIVHHRNNDDWKGKSPQQHALNRAMKEDVVTRADWIIHIDVDEFINVRCGNGTLADFLDLVPDATNVAMTWRLFGHNGVTRLADDLVIGQFDMCAPKYCPKPHTAWGFKTMVRNIGAYAKLGCHRPNKLDKAHLPRVKWVNGSGRDMTREAAQKGWRNSKSSIGYDLLQLNHYALRSAESFLVKRQRGRALHVDRSIGLNYWIRMDWSYVRDITIQRNIPRLRAEMERLKADPTLARLHDEGFAWHRAKAAELHAIPEFRDLYAEALRIRLTDAERVAYALALDLET
ncbi:MAG: glycosyltransferase family 2 protein [Rhodobacteraceae bacterium]|nr:MAG: glycosyltransferase family 2 protein [Paracoccaceae bacterium]